jgi:hypothetical protein
MRILFTFMCGLALGVTGCSETSGTGGTAGGGGAGGDGGAITPGLWLGGSPASNTDGNPFDTGWAICFHVNEDGTALTPSPDCDIDGPVEGENPWVIEVNWKDDVGIDPADEGCSATGAFDKTVPIEDNAFDFSTHGAVRVVGSFEGDTATGTAIYADLGPPCELVGGWTASPAP